MYVGYRTHDDRLLFVAQGLGDRWIVAHRTPSGGLKRFKSPRCPVTETREECQANLDAYAQDVGWRRESI